MATVQGGYKLKFTIRYGALQPSLVNQLAEQGLTSVGGPVFQWFQDDADALNRMEFRELIGSKEIEAAKKKLTERINKFVEKNS